jgi:RNA polymerase sigma-32 factor
MDADLGQVALEPIGNRAASSGSWVSLLARQSRSDTSQRAEHRQGPAPEVPGRTGGLISREEELRLFYRWKTRGEDRALHILVLAYEPLVAKIVKGLRRSGVSVEDARQEARCGLLEAARRFDPSKGFRLGTYARGWMLSAVTTYLVANKDMLSSRRMKGKPTMLPPNFVSLDAPMTSEAESAADLVAWDEESPDLTAERTIDGERIQHRLTNALNSLEPRERLVVQRRHLNDKGETLQTVANDMHITAERVRQIEKMALARLRKRLEGNHGEREVQASESWS